MADEVLQSLWEEMQLDVRPEWGTAPELSCDVSARISGRQRIEACDVRPFRRSKATEGRAANQRAAASVSVVSARCQPRIHRKCC